MSIPIFVLCGLSDLAKQSGIYKNSWLSTHCVKIISEGAFKINTQIGGVFFLHNAMAVIYQDSSTLEFICNSFTNLEFMTNVSLYYFCADN